MVGCEEDEENGGTAKSGGVVRAVVGKEEAWRAAALPGANVVRQAPVREDGGPHRDHPAWLHAETGRRES
ncbi:hypothetical protein GCM10010359_14660 [Streptomyces morookaense]|nr:hypothetical protein GCM10010359_14660 [Streptomyces morookaense]